MTDLTAQDFALFEQIRVPEEVLLASGVQRATQDEARILLGLEDVASDGIVFQHYFPPLNAHQTSQPIAFRFRQDNPPTDSAGVAIRKYLSSPGAQHPFVPAGIPRAWYKDTSVPVLICEGPKQSLAILAWCLRTGRRMIVAGVNGCYGWSGKTGIASNADGEREHSKGLLPLLEEICRGRRIFILFDADEATKPLVRAGRNKLAEALQGIATSVKFGHLPPSIQQPHRGPDDYLGSHSDSEFAEILETMEPYVPGLAPRGVLNEEEVSTMTAAEVKSTATEWYWKERIPKNYITVFSGNPDVGKSTVMIDLIMRLTTGRDWPDGETNDAPEGLNILYMAAEDGYADVIKPRLVAAGANLEHVHFLAQGSMKENPTRKEAHVYFDRDLERLKRRLVREPRIDVVVVDPLTSYLAKVDLNKEIEVRRVLGPIKEMCQELPVTFFALGHFNKRGDVVALHKVSGAVANTGLPRAVWLFMKDPSGAKGDMLMLLGKGNFAKRRTGLRYRFEEKIVLCDDGKETGVPIINWQGESDVDADDANQLAGPEARDAVKGEHLLKHLLATEERPTTEILAAAEAKGISRRTLFDVKKRLEIVAHRNAGMWWWGPFKGAK